MTPADLPQRFAQRVVVADNGCWLWTGSIDNSGYGQLGLSRVHRAVYEAVVGPVPRRLDVDHTCHNADRGCRGKGADCLHRRCVNPVHLDPATRGENQRRAWADYPTKQRPKVKPQTIADVMAKPWGWLVAADPSVSPLEVWPL